MFIATSNRSRRLLVLRYIGTVQAAELALHEADIRALAVELPPGFRVLQDLSQVAALDANCFDWMGRLMDFFAERGVSQVVRVIPDPAKDIGFNLLTIFHYPQNLPIVICQNLIEAAPYLEPGA